jgi:phenylacetic acid degradation protein
MAIFRFEDRTPEVDETAWVAESALVIGRVRIGKHAYIGHGAILRGDYGEIVIGDGTAIEEGVIVHARPDDRAVFGERVTVGHGAMVHNATIEDDAVIGMRATVSDYARVGRWAIVGEMALVKNGQEIPERSLAVGVPAKVIGPITEKHEAIWTYGKQLYIEMAARYRAPGAFERVG